MVRQVIQIDEEKCNGCGLCANACHEGAIDIVGGKAKLVRENFCDGFGDCLPNCPQGAITFVEKEAPAYDEAAVQKAKEAKENARREQAVGAPHQCPGSAMRDLRNKQQAPVTLNAPVFGKPQSELTNWPVQIKLAPITAPYFDGAKLLIAADCTAFAYANIHQEFIKGHVTLIGCSKLDDIDYTEKLTEIIKQNDIQEITILRMEVPCCGGLEYMAKEALKKSGKFLPWHTVIVGIDGNLI